jgi:exopolysaccharide production protein ExoZ
LLHGAGMVYNIQFARAIAALLVVYAHIAVPGYNFGHFGVNIFFVISGFIMTMICCRNPKHFFPRRLVRIAPLYWLATLAVFGLSLGRPSLLNSTTSNGFNLLKSILFIPYAKEDGQIRPMLEVGWTLNYEIYFYAMIAIALLFSRPQLATLIALGMMIFIQGICSLLLAQGYDQNAAFGPVVKFYSSYEIEEFLFGTLIYHFTSNLKNVRIHPAILLAVALASLVYLTCHQVYRIGFGPSTVNMSLPSALFVLALVWLENENFILTKLTLLGDASYSLYLTNQFVVEGYRKIGAKILHIPIYSIPGILLVILASALFSILIFKLIEKPMHDAMRKHV